MSTKFDQSAIDGPHSLLPRLVGEWTGTAKLWFERDELVEENPVRCTTRLVLQGRFLHVEYQTQTQEYETFGIGIYGYDLNHGRWIGSQVDNYHNGTMNMCSEGDGLEVPDGLSVVGKYPDGQGGYWGWRTQIHLAAPDSLVFAYYNIPPGEAEYIAVEYAMTRV